MKALPSCVRWTDPFLIAIVIISAYALLYATALDDTEIVLALASAVAIVMSFIEIIKAPWRKQVRPDIPFKTTLHHAFIKWLGILAGIAFVLFVWWLLPEYRTTRHQALRDVAFLILPWVPFVTAAWVLFTEWRLGPEKDHSWFFGLLVLGRFKEVDWSIARLGLMGWVVKGFFLPLNISGAVSYIQTFRGTEDTLMSLSWPQAVSMIDSMLFALLLVAIIPGYVFSSRLLGTNIKKVDQSWFGWCVTLLCYPPVNMGTRLWFSYGIRPVALEGDPWVFFTAEAPSIAVIVGIAILFFEAIHYWGESICGLRSSHLSNRGIITNGPFSFTKHPVYVSKCLLWIFWFMPFLGGPAILDDVRRTLIFLVFCGVFAMRGWVEERLLSEDPAFVNYALYMDQKSVFRWVGRLIPLFNYEYRLRRWVANGEVPASALKALG